MCLIFNPFGVCKLYTDIEHTKTKLNNDNSYSTMLLRRRYRKRVILVTITFAISFYLSSLLFGRYYIPQILKLTQLTRCPACYGVSVCPELYSDQIVLEDNLFSFASLFNAKNIYYGYTKSNPNLKVVLKKLAHNKELDEFDSKLCKTWGLNYNCKPLDLLKVPQSVMEEKIKQAVHYDWISPPHEPRKGLIFCPYEDSVFDFLKITAKQIRGKNAKVLDKTDLLNSWTMLNINPEPIILQNVPQSAGWPVPKYGGVCGRLELVSHAGVSLSSLDRQKMTWHQRLLVAKQILDAAMDFTFKHERFRFYLMDWSLDNIVVNDRNQITFVDLEDIIVLDKNTQSDKNLTEWYKRDFKEYSKDEGFFFSIQNICMHHLSDHNLYAACHILAGPDRFIYPIPEGHRNYTKLISLLDRCLKSKEDTFHTGTALQSHVQGLIEKIVDEEKRRN